MPLRMATLFALNDLRWYLRLPIKWTLLALTVLLVCFPYPQRLIRHVQRMVNPDQLIDPDAPVLEPLADELRAILGPDLSPREALQRIELYVYEKIPYEWDWNTWGTADYLPTVDEVIEMGKEDCDGRAVVAASLLRYFGFRAQLVSDFSHMWVKTDLGETMGPGKTKVFTATDKGVRMDAGALRELPKAVAYDIAVFPLRRELIVIMVMWLLLLQRNCGMLCDLSGGVMFLAALGLLRAGSEDYFHPTLWMQSASLLSFGAGLAVLVVYARSNARRAEAKLLRIAPESADNSL